MGLLRRIIETRRTLGGGRLQILMDAIIPPGDFNLCSMQNQSLIVTCTSLVTLSIAEVRLVATGLSSVATLSMSEVRVTATGLTSVYSLSQA